MKKFFRTCLLCFLAAVTLSVYAFAAEDTLKVGLYYGSSALFSANLENYQGSGYELGWFDEGTREFVYLGWLEEERISMTADGDIYIGDGAYYSERPSYVDAVIGGYHLQLEDEFEDYDAALYVAEQFEEAFPAFVNNVFRVRIGSFTSREEAEVAAALYDTYTFEDLLGDEWPVYAEVVSPSATGLTVTETTTDHILFEFDCSGAKCLGVMPVSGRKAALTWFKGYKWYGGFEYRRSTGGNINVINVVDIDDYVKGVLPYEMNPSWPLEALKAQAVCARTYALLQTKHYASYRFDVCNTVDCQVYQGTNRAGELTDRAAEETSGVVACYDGELAETYYYSSNGGASESSENVWSEALPHLVGKEDPFEAMTSIPGYSYSETYTFAQLTDILEDKGYDIGEVTAVYVSKTTPNGNVAEVTFQGKRGATVRVTGERAKTIFYTTLFGDTKSVKSMRFTISGGGGGAWYVNSAGISIPTVSGMYVISGSGDVGRYEGSAEDTYVLTSAGTSLLQPEEKEDTSGTITITGTGSGHNVGMSQYGAKAMAEMGYTYEEILCFYYTDIELELIA